jgi:hypothetical protein
MENIRENVLKGNIGNCLSVGNRNGMDHKGLSAKDEVEEGNQDDDTADLQKCSQHADDDRGNDSKSCAAEFAAAIARK